MQADENLDRHDCFNGSDRITLDWQQRCQRRGLGALPSLDRLLRHLDRLLRRVGNLLQQLRLLQVRWQLQVRSQ